MEDGDTNWHLLDDPILVGMNGGEGEEGGARGGEQY